MSLQQLTRSEYDNCVFDEEGKPMKFKEWLTYFSSKDRYRRESKVNGYTIVTAWIGVDMPPPHKLTPGFKFARWTPNEVPLIFEGIVYDQDMLPLYRHRFESREKAYKEHSLLLKEYSS